MNHYNHKSRKTSKNKYSLKISQQCNQMSINMQKADLALARMPYSKN